MQPSSSAVPQVLDARAGKNSHHCVFPERGHAWTPPMAPTCYVGSTRGFCCFSKDRLMLFLAGLP